MVLEHVCKGYGLVPVLVPGHALVPGLVLVLVLGLVAEAVYHDAETAAEAASSARNTTHSQGPTAPEPDWPDPRPERGDDYRQG